MKRFFLLLFASTCTIYSIAQQNSAERAKSLVASLGLKDDQNKSSVQSIIQLHLDSLQSVFDKRKLEMDRAQTIAANNKELADARSEVAWKDATGRLNKLYAVFQGKLSTLLTNKQIVDLKNLMTENGLKREYDSFLEKFPDLKENHKEQIIAYLEEARENAMNAESASNRKEWFIKYRGRANNYLAAAGYDLRKATEELEKKKKGIGN